VPEASLAMARAALGVGFVVVAFLRLVLRFSLGFSLALELGQGRIGGNIHRRPSSDLCQEFLENRNLAHNILLID